MKEIRNHKKTTILSVFIALIITLTACNNEESSLDSTFPKIDNAKIPDVLETVVGTLGDCYFSEGTTDNPDYNSILAVTYNDTTETDYTKLMDHYKSASIGTDENGSLLFDWGELKVTTDNGSISINAFIK